MCLACVPKPVYNAHKKMLDQYYSTASDLRLAYQQCMYPSIIPFQDAKGAKVAHARSHKSWHLLRRQIKTDGAGQECFCEEPG